MSKTNAKRIYAIGDIHGCIDDLRAMQARIAADLAASPHPDPLVVYLGDYIDRGPDSRAVIEALIQARDAALPARFLYGNHDAYIELFLNDPTNLNGRMLHWLHERMGGAQTLRAYGVPDATEADPIPARDAFLAAIPQTHRDFLQSCERGFRIGGYYFVHAGVHPERALDAQQEIDQIWIREPFLSWQGDFGAIIVHGHSPVKQVENHGNRIDVDTGAVFGRHLSCLVLEDSRQELLTPEGRADCPVGHGLRR